jgi:ParB family chromosome partitioning protein
LGSKLSPAVREAWRDDKIDAEIAQALTLAPDKTSQERVLAKAIKDDRYDAADVVHEFKIRSDVGLMLDFVGFEAYEKRGGKIERDLFGSNHRASDDKLVKAMHGEALDALAEKLVKVDGWAWARQLKTNEYPYDYGRLPNKDAATMEEMAQLQALENDANDYDLSDAKQRAAQIEHDKLHSQIIARSYTPEARAKGGVFIKWSDHNGLELDFGRTKPEQRKKVEAQERVATRDKKVKAAKKDGAVGVISNALHQRLSEQLTAAVAKTIGADPKLALPAILAGFAAGGLGRESPVKVEVNGAGETAQKSVKFAAALAGYIKMGLPAQLQALAAVSAASIDMGEQHVYHKPLKNESNTVLIGAMNAKAFNDAMRASFAPKDYFDAVSKDLCLAAISEAINPDEARKLNGKPKVDVAKFAVANVPKTKWLPLELRTVHYDGPVKKAAPAKAKRK